MNNRIKALIIEDESRAASRLQTLLQQCDPNVDVVEVVDTVRRGKAFFAGNPNLDLIFCDVQLGDGISFEIFEEHPPKQPVIFTTAYDQYAIQAFKSNGVDYLLKPLDEDELCAALKKFRKAAAPQLDVEALLAGLKGRDQVFKTRFMVAVGDKLKTIPTNDVLCFYSAEKSTYLQTIGGRSYPLDTTLDQIEGQVDPKRFFRISRKYLVALDAPIEIYQWSNSRLKLTLPHMEDYAIIVARERTKAYKVWLGDDAAQPKF